VPSDVTIQVLTQAREELIAVRSRREGRASRQLALYNSTSIVQRRDVFGLDRAGIKAIAVKGAKWLKECARRSPRRSAGSFNTRRKASTGTELDSRSKWWMR